MAVNVPNRGELPDVADGHIIEVGAMVDGDGIHADRMPPLGEPLAGWIKVQTDLQDLIVRAAIEGDAELAWQAFRDDPNAPPAEADARKAFDELRRLQAELLPI
jgi:alpha-galactosidase